MRSMASSGLSPLVRVAVCIAIVSALTLSRSPVQAVAASNGLAYDELNKVVMAGQGSGPPEAGTYANGSFGADFQAAVNTGGPPKASHGLFSAISNAVAAGQQAMNMVKNGTPSTHYFLNGWERNDDPIAKTATIYRGDLKQIIHLDLGKKTYYIETMGEKMGAETPPPMPSGSQGPQAPPEPGTAKMTISASTAALGPKTLDSQPTQGYKMSFKMAVTEATGSCKNGSFQTSMTEFISQFPEPMVGTPSGKVIPRKSALDPQKMVVKPGCKPTITANAKVGATPPSGMLALWMFMDMSGAMNSAQPNNTQSATPPPGGSFGFIVERGNVRTLGASDKSLFEVPAGFTQTSGPSSPSP